MIEGRIRNLVILPGDQRDETSSAFDPALDIAWMAEMSEHVWSAKQRIAVFLSAMRHFAQDLRAGIGL